MQEPALQVVMNHKTDLYVLFCTSLSTRQGRNSGSVQLTRSSIFSNFAIKFRLFLPTFLQIFMKNISSYIWLCIFLSKRNPFCYSRCTFSHSRVHRKLKVNFPVKKTKLSRLIKRFLV